MATDAEKLSSFFSRLDAIRADMTNSRVSIPEGMGLLRSLQEEATRAQVPMRINFERFRRLVPTDPNNTPQVPEEEEEDSSSSSSSEDY
jgi:hypothetical protein